MRQHDEPEGFVLATGDGRTVWDFSAAAFAHAGLECRDHVTYEEQYERPLEVDGLDW